MEVHVRVPEAAWGWGLSCVYPAGLQGPALAVSPALDLKDPGTTAIVGSCACHTEMDVANVSQQMPHLV